MKGYIDNYNFSELEIQKYWSFPKSVKDPKTEARNMVMSNNYIGSRKMDGAMYVFIKDEDGNMELRGRSKSVNGEYLNKIGHVPQFHDFFNSLPNGTCLIGELVFINNEGSRNTTTIMGCKEDKAITRQESGDKLTYYIFDILAFNNHNFLNVNIEDRVTELKDLETEYINKSEYLLFAKYLIGKDLWEELQSILGENGEGIVLTKIGTHYQPGKRPARQTLKIKKEVSDNIDCFFTGHIQPPTIEYTGKDVENWKYYMNTKTGEKIEGHYYLKYLSGEPYIPITKNYFYDFAGSLEIGVLDKNKNIVPIGWLSGLTEEIKKNHQDYKYKCIEVNAMMIENEGTLRHAKFVQFRPDLSMEDCTYEKFRML